MPPNLDIYGLTKQRDLKTINRFLELYVDRVASEHRDGEELMIRRLDLSTFTDSAEDYEWEPALTLSNSIQRGLDYPRRSFSIYLTPKHADMAGALISFTTDNQLIIGLSIDDEGTLPRNEQLAKSLLTDLAEQFDCHLGLITVEEPPPSTEAEFRWAADKPLTIFFRDFTEFRPKQ